jgi:glycosyltransferase involved in cell wall biosynthesis
MAGLQLFESKYRLKDPKQYREYTLDLIAIGEDYLSEQIKAIGNAILGNNLHIYPIVSLKKALEITNKCNVTVCASLNETFGLFVAEGMLMGHVLLRNHTSGWQEQVLDGENGYLFDDLNVDDLAKKISIILSKNNSDEKLAEMGLKSQQIAAKFSNANYYDQLLKI